MLDSSSPHRALIASLAVLFAVSAHAHGGLPETNSFTLRRGHPEEQWMGFTLGALLSRDGGRTWRWVCAEAIGYGARAPESYLWHGGGDLLAATGNTLLRSRDSGCSWTPHPAFQELWVTGLAAHPTDDALLYASTGRPAVDNTLFRSENGGETWAPTALRRAAVFSAVRLAPSDPRRLYLSGWKRYAQYLFRSDDAGETWEDFPQPLPGLPGAFDLKLLAVSPVTPNVLWARVTSRAASGNPLYTVLRSDDGGRTLTPALELDDPLVNLDVSPDGRTVWVSTYNRFYRSREHEPFTLLPLPTGNACATNAGDVLYACGSTWLHDWALARSTDQGSSWKPVFALSDVQGVHQCPQGTPVREQCTPLWPQLASQIGAPLYPDAPPDAGVPDAGDVGPMGPPMPNGCTAAAGDAAPAALLLFLVAVRRRGPQQARLNSTPRGPRPAACQRVPVGAKSIPLWRCRRWRNS